MKKLHEIIYFLPLRSQNKLAHVDTTFLLDTINFKIVCEQQFNKMLLKFN